MAVSAPLHVPIGTPSQECHDEIHLIGWFDRELGQAACINTIDFSVIAEDQLHRARVRHDYFMPVPDIKGRKRLQILYGVGRLSCADRMISSAEYQSASAVFSGLPAYSHNNSATPDVYAAEDSSRVGSALLSGESRSC